MTKMTAMRQAPAFERAIVCLFRSFVFNKVCINYCHLSFFFCFVFFPLKGAVHTVGTHSDVEEEVTPPNIQLTRGSQYVYVMIYQ